MSFKDGVLILILVSIWWVVFSSIDRPPFYYFDETTYVDAGQSLIESHQMTDNSEHPPVGKWMIGSSRNLFSDKIFGSRIPSYISALLVLLALTLCSSYFMPYNKISLSLRLLPATFASFDPFFLNLSKIAMLDMISLAFFMFSFYLLISNDNKSFLKFLGSAVLLGFSIATKWIFFPLAIIAVLFKHGFRKWKQWTNYFLVALITYIICFLAFTDMSAPWYFEFFNRHLEMLQFHENFQVQNVFSSPWWTWPLFLNPLKLTLDTSQGYLRALVLIGNPIIHWLLLPTAFVWTLKKRTRNLFLLLCLYFVGWLMWGLVTRSTFAYYYITAVPFIYILVPAALEKVFSKSVFYYAFLISAGTFLLVFTPFITYSSIEPNPIQMFFLFR